MRGIQTQYSNLRTSVVAIDVATGKENFQLQGHTDAIMWMGFSPDDEFIASAVWDGYLKLYSSKDGRLIWNYGPTGGQNWACDFDGEGKKLGGHSRRHQVRLFGEQTTHDVSRIPERDDWMAESHFLFS
jgi:WD40 repeat protein